VLLRKGQFKPIVTVAPEFYDYFIAATHESKRLNLMQKSERVALFDSMIPARFQSYKRQAQEARDEEPELQLGTRRL